jgi:hypothetical protein
VLSNDFFLRRLPIGFTINHRFEWQDNFLLSGEEEKKSIKTSSERRLYLGTRMQIHSAKPGERLNAPRTAPDLFLKGIRSSPESYPAQ